MQTPEAAEEARREAIRQEVGNNPLGWNTGYPAPPGVVVPPYGTQGAPKVAKLAVAIVGWILVIESGGSAAPVLRPILIPL